MVNWRNEIFHDFVPVATQSQKNIRFPDFDLARLLPHAIDFATESSSHTPCAFDVEWSLVMLIPVRFVRPPTLLIDSDIIHKECPRKGRCLIGIADETASDG